MNYDITYCSNRNCKNKECKRNWVNIDYTKATANIWVSEFRECESWEDKK